MKQVAVGRLAKVLMKGLVVAAGFAAGISGWADSAQNGFIKVEGDVKFGDVSDEEIIITDPPGPKSITIQGRDGWNPDKPQRIDIPAGGSVTIPVDGKDGENDKEVVIKDKSGEGDPPPPPPVNPPGDQDQPGDTTPPGDENQDDQEDTTPDENPPKEDCSHPTNMVPEHASSPTIAPKEETANVVAIYSYPEIGVPVPKEIEFEEHTEGTHEVYAVISACEKCGTAQQKFLDHNATIHATEEYRYSCIAEGAVEGADGRKYLPYGKHEVKYTAYWEGSNCPENKCHCSADGYRKYFVYLAGLTSPEYIGLDMTDEGKKTWKEYEASASITPDEDRSKTVSWELVSEHSVFENGTKSAKTDGEPVKFGGLKEDPTPSEKYRGETIRAIVTLPDAKGGNGSATVTNAFTVVKVDVEIDGVKEEVEEVDGAYLYYVPDAIGTLWTQEGTNALKKVSFKVEPKDLPSDQTVTIEVRKGLLFEKKDGQYKPAKSSYTLEELKDSETTFRLHGHDRSEEYLGDSITLTHDLSGAKDVAKFTIFGRPWLVPDYDRDGKIDDADEVKAKDGKTVFRFWINDDDDGEGSDEGDIVEWDDHIPEKGDDYKAEKVQGRSDLVDYTPICINLSEVFPAGTPDSLRTTVHWKLFSDQYKAVWTNLSKDEAGSFQENEIKCCGENYNYFPREAPVVALTGVEIPICYATNLWGVILVEGIDSGNQFTIRGERGDALFSKGDLLTCVSPVKSMFRWINLRHHAGQTDGGWDTDLDPYDSPNRPKAECDNRHFIAVHGYNVNKVEARPWASEIFKRLWQSGSNSRFTAVDWLGDDGQLPLVKKTPNYYKNVEHAFDQAAFLKDACDALPGERHVFLAHSLGNMLTSAAIQDYSMKCSQYYLLNAATPRQSYNPSTETDKTMVDGDWTKIPDSYWAAKWYKLYESEGNDFRHYLNWPGRFKDVPGVVNCYASTEPVASDNAPLSVWRAQERCKGLRVWGFGTLFGEAGWGFRSDAPTSKKDLSNYPLSQAKWNPIFGHFGDKEEDAKIRTNGTYAVSNMLEHGIYMKRAKRLAYGIPATSGPCGSGEINGKDNIDYLSCRNKSLRWPRKKDVWAHSDLVEVAYIHMKKFYDKVVRGECK